jgi:hypothetical protein
MTKRDERYNELTYGGVINRIVDGVPLSPHQKRVMVECGLTEEDFKNQLSLEEKCAIVNAHRMLKQLQESGSEERE